MSAKSYIESSKDRSLEELFSLIRTPLVSAERENKPDMLTCTQRWAKALLSLGADKIEVVPTKGNLVAYAEEMVSPNAPTVSIHAHHDMMPVEPLKLWKSEPFEPVIRDGRIWAHGADDDRGQGMIQVRGFEIVVKEGLL